MCLEYAVFVTEGRPSTAYRSRNGLYEQTKYHLRGFVVVVIPYISFAYVMQQLALIPNGRIKFLIFRGHGRPTFIDLSNGYVPDDVKQILGPIIGLDDLTWFTILTEKMAPNSFIMLQSCSTGEFKDGFDNMAMAFLELVKNCDTRVIAPSADSYDYGIFPAGKKQWKFAIFDKFSNNIAVCYGKAVKEAAEPGPADIEADTKGMLCDGMVALAQYVDRAWRNPGEYDWYLDRLIWQVVKRPSTTYRPKLVFSCLLYLLPPAQMTNTHEFRDMRRKHTSPKNSLLLKCIAKAFHKPNSCIAKWMPLLLRWAKRHSLYILVCIVTNAYKTSKLAAARSALTVP